MGTNAVSFVATDKSWFQILDPAQTGLDMLTSDWTVSFWINWTSNSATQTIVAKGGTSTGNPGYHIRIGSAGQVLATLSVGGSLVLATSTTNLTAGWKLVVVKFDRDGNLTISINGTDAGGAADISSLSASSNTTADFLVGNYSATGTYYLNSILQDLSIHSRLLTAAEVSFMYNSGTPYKYNAWGIAGTDGSQLKVGLVSYWYLNASGTTAADSHGSNTLTMAAAAIISPTVYGSELLTNGGFETVTAAGPPANFGTWVDDAGDGNLEVETTDKRSGSNAAKLTSGASANAVTYQTFAVTAGQTVRIAIWSHGDGTNSPRYGIRDVTNSKQLVNPTNTGVTGASYDITYVDQVVPAGCSQLRIQLWGPSANGGVAYFDDISAKAVVTDGVLNGGFESWTTSTNAASWTESVAGTSTVTREDTVVYSGTNAAALNVDGSNSVVTVYQTICTATKSYAYTVYARAASGTPSFKVTDNSSGSTVHTLTTSFVAYTGTHTPSNTRFDLSRQSATSNTIYLDSVTLTASNILTGTGLDGAAPPAETQRWNPNLMGWYLQEMEQDWWSEDEPGTPPATPSPASGGRLCNLGVGVGVGGG